MNAEEVLTLKVRLLTEGVILPEGEWTGRRGGAGPVGSRYLYYQMAGHVEFQCEQVRWSRGSVPHLWFLQRKRTFGYTMEKYD